MRVITKLIAAVAFTSLLFSSVALASHNDAIPTGIRIEVTNVNSGTGQVDFDVVVSSYSYATTTSGSTLYGKELPSAWIGDRFFYNWYPGTQISSSGSTATTEWVLVDPTGIKALDFGDGVMVDAAQLAIEINAFPRTYRGSFSHTYAMPGNYTITSKVVGVYLGTTASPNYSVNYGNPIAFSPNFTTTNYTISGNPYTYTYSGFLANRLESGTELIGGIGEGMYSSTMLGLSNTAQVSLSAVLNTIAIPSLDEFSKLLMGLFIALAGGWVLIQRR